MLGFIHTYGGEAGTRTLNAFRHNGFQDRLTPIITPLLIMVGRAGIEPAEAFATRFTVWPAALYGIPTHILYIRHFCFTSSCSKALYP